IVAGTDRIGGHRDVAHREDVDALAAIAQLRPEDGDDTPPVGYKLSVFLAQPIELPKQPWGFLGGLAILFPGLERIIRRQEPGLARTTDGRHGQIVRRPIRLGEGLHETLGLEFLMGGSFSDPDLLAEDLQDFGRPAGSRRGSLGQCVRRAGQKQRNREESSKISLHRRPPPRGVSDVGPLKARRKRTSLLYRFSVHAQFPRVEPTFVEGSLLLYGRRSIHFRSAAARGIRPSR